MSDGMYYMFLIGKNWANQYGRGVRIDQLYSTTLNPKKPKGYTWIGKKPTGRLRRISKGGAC